MRCPFCGTQDDRVVDSRASQEGAAIRRRRECLGCGRRFTTYEYIEEASVTIIKSDGRRESFDRAKLSNGLRLACTKRPISTAQIDEVVDQIEANILGRGEKEVRSQIIGEMVMAHLKALDEIAYVRFASVYRQFKDKNEFMEELKQMLD
jgi:transcriptional repressor NrdR